MHRGIRSPARPRASWTTLRRAALFATDLRAMPAVRAPRGASWTTLHRLERQRRAALPDHAPPGARRELRRARSSRQGRRRACSVPRFRQDVHSADRALHTPMAHQRSTVSDCSHDDTRTQTRCRVVRTIRGGACLRRKARSMSLLEAMQERRLVGDGADAPEEDTGWSHDDGKGAQPCIRAVLFSAPKKRWK
jgi:hypothetical protein